MFDVQVALPQYADYEVYAHLLQRVRGRSNRNTATKVSILQFTLFPVRRSDHVPPVTFHISLFLFSDYIIIIVRFLCIHFMLMMFLICGGVFMTHKADIYILQTINTRRIF